LLETNNNLIKPGDYLVIKWEEDYSVVISNKGFQGNKAKGYSEHKAKD